MHNKTKLLIFASLLLAACSTDPMQEIPNRGDSAPEIETSGKICNTSDDAVAGSLIVKFGEEAIPSLEQNALNAAKTRSALTRSGIESVDDILNDLHVTSLERVFPEAGEHEARTRGRASQMVCARVRIGRGSRQGGRETRRCRRNLESTVPHPSLPGFRLQNLSVSSNGERPDPRFGYSGFQRPESFLAVALHQQCRPGRCHYIGGRSRHQCGRRMEAHGR